MRQPCALFVAVRHDSLLNSPVDLLLRPIRGADKAIEARKLQEQTHQANPTRTSLDTHQVDRQDQSMQEGQTGDAVKKRYDRGMLIKVLWVYPPGL